MREWRRYGSLECASGNPEPGSCTGNGCGYSDLEEGEKMYLGVVVVCLFAVAIAWADFTGRRRVRRLLWFLAAGTVFAIGLVL